MASFQVSREIFGVFLPIETKTDVKSQAYKPLALKLLAI
jgi:hypothetical protein